MKVIFIKDLRNQGKKYEIKEVKPGYGNNFLIKKGYALLYNEENLKKVENMKALEEEKLESELKELTDLKEEIDNLNLIFNVKTKGNKVYGSIKPSDISKKLKSERDIDLKAGLIKENINTLGNHKIKVDLGRKVIAEFTVRLESDE